MARNFKIRLSSHHAVGGSNNSDFIVDFETAHPEMIRDGIKAVGVYHVSFPNTIYNVNANTRTFKWYQGPISTHTATVGTLANPPKVRLLVEGFGEIGVTISDGVYTHATWVTAVNNAMQTAYNTLTGLPTGEIEFTIDTAGVEWKYQLGINTERRFRLEFDSDDIEQNFSKYCGFSVKNPIWNELRHTHKSDQPPFAHCLLPVDDPNTHIPYGFYEWADLTTQLAEEMVEVAGGLLPTFSIQPHTHKTVMTNPNGDSLLFGDVTFSELPTLLGYVGLPDDVQASPYLSESTINMNGDGVLYLHSRLIVGENTLAGDEARVSMLKAIPVDAAYGDLICFTPNEFDHPSTVFPHRKGLRRMNLTLRDTRGRVVDINNGVLTCIISLWY